MVQGQSCSFLVALLLLMLAHDREFQNCSNAANAGFDSHNSLRASEGFAWVTESDRKSLAAIFN